ncbi:Fe-S cluster assembly protein HesB [Cryobacterium tepidiphilum]|jgi:Fe-S cluster assembly iron-binding protein IscA|uniref:Fe-S cluster assembly protein HesB n=1 Tax=Cryobacterium tepidiphilum TaxID=2486026 RepID=A0A3M8L198_9MICO|nr:Fe-S cluster assembly protein HesB [Cryobacterium tepidiphilum]RNE59283.1 Fe-S cluster assembly protein HesB [Cryobacterium tepidiphilum]
MLTLTEDARTIVKTIASQAADSDAGGLRISATESDSMDFALALVAAPEPKDEVVEQAGARVFLEEHAAATLADKVLDAQVDTEGAVSFAIGDPA